MDILHYINYNLFVSIIEIGIILISTWFFYSRFIKGTSSAKIVRGLFILALGWVFSVILIKLHLIILGVFLRYVVMFIALGLVVIFQPELRKFLGIMGQFKLKDLLFARKKIQDKNEINYIIDEIIKAVIYMSSKHTGALIVFQNETLIENPGIILNADISSELLLTIFHNKTPLHDGAVIIKNNKIFSAGGILPLTDKNKINWQYGTRHRAGLGASENYDAVVLIVSEETGNISIASKGNLNKINDPKKLHNLLKKVIEK